MASNVTRVADNIINDTKQSETNPMITCTREKLEESRLNDEIYESAASSYTFGSGRSQFSSALDTWLGSATESTGVQGSRVPVAQRSTLATPSTIDASGLWYILAMVLPLFSVNNLQPVWRCTPSTILNTAELFFTQLASVCETVKNRIRRLAQDEYARDVFATMMDVVLVVYAMGYLMLSIYQATIIV
ncbi:uncharacterized protein LOC113515285 [Galleria mellonella]|uniref:Uncharacterized protein LOC113515285 n=1 Tax=Galleria mellonella TaxID=7137 RepID=A0A6J1WL40_GALME|nr:uncharacterized protein LOC113515285 [Galleria mellonella]